MPENEKEAKDTSGETSDDILRQIEEMTEEPELEETGGESEQETAEKKQEQEAKEAEALTEEQLRQYFKNNPLKLNVDGQVVLIDDYDRLVNDAQKGHFLEQERAKDKRLAQEGGEVSWDQYNEKIVAKAKTEGIGQAILQVVRDFVETKETQQREIETKADSLASDQEWAKNPEYRGMLNSLIRRGSTPEHALAETSAAYWKEKAVKAQETGADKVKAQQNARIPEGKETGGPLESSGEARAPSAADFAAMAVDPHVSSADMLKIMQKHGVRIGRDPLIE